MVQGFFFQSIMEETKTISPWPVESRYQQLDYSYSLPSYSELFLLRKTILFLILYVLMKQKKYGLSILCHLMIYYLLEAQSMDL